MLHGAAWAISFHGHGSSTYLPLLLLLLLLTESELDERLQEPEPLGERAAREAWPASRCGEGLRDCEEWGERLRLWW